MHITKWGEYGILCSLLLARRFGSGAVGASEVAELEGVPLDYTHQILHRLRKGGIVVSARGPHGGYALSRAPQEINLRQIMDAVEGDTFEVICDHNPLDIQGRCSPSAACALRHVWHDLKVAVDGILESKTLQDLLASGSPDKLVTLEPRKSDG